MAPDVVKVLEGILGPVAGEYGQVVLSFHGGHLKQMIPSPVYRGEEIVGALTDARKGESRR